jgi:hypothetical protein
MHIMWNLVFFDLEKWLKITVFRWFWHTLSLLSVCDFNYRIFYHIILNSNLIKSPYRGACDKMRKTLFFVFLRCWAIYLLPNKWIIWVSFSLLCDVWLKLILLAPSNLMLSWSEMSEFHSFYAILVKYHHFHASNDRRAS